MELGLSDEEANELRRLLEGALSELSSEIADTDNAMYVRELRARRDSLPRDPGTLGGRLLLGRERNGPRDGGAVFRGIDVEPALELLGPGPQVVEPQATLV